MPKSNGLLLLTGIVSAAIAFAVFPLTDTDIWWHLACAREWVTTWTPVRTPVVNVHEFFQKVTAFVFNQGGASLLVAFKAVLWGIVFGLFLAPMRNSIGRFPWIRFVFAACLLFLFRYQLEIRPVVFSLLFLGIYWNLLPLIFQSGKNPAGKKIALGVVLLLIQWIWCKCQGLYILGPLFATSVFIIALQKAGKDRRRILPWGLLPLALFAMPFLHREGLSLFLYPLGLLDRLLGLTQSASVFASQIAENRSPVTLLLAGENTLVSFGMLFLAVVSVGHEILRVLILRKQVLRESPRNLILHFALLTTAVLAQVAERNFVLFLPVFLTLLLTSFPSVFIPPESFRLSRRKGFCINLFTLVFMAFLLGLWLRSLQAYDRTMVSYQRVPVAAAEWMNAHPHQGRLFNDDRAGGYLAFTNPADSIYMDGRFILKTADFFERNLHFADNPAGFLEYADSTGIDRALFPLQYYARWGKVLDTLLASGNWQLVYKDEYFCIFQR
ncbi:MAG: hypothetical protein MJY87_08675 [Fibrobacter sp.]|nr:hypothetical protein [Fibrobacter sp.]